jgi:sigma-54 specific flagellar transcriptional regulator A
VGGAPAAVSGAPAAVAGRPALPDGGIDLRQALTGVESELIDQALERCAGNRTQAAALLGLRRTALVEKLRRRSAAAATSPQRRG